MRTVTDMLAARARSAPDRPFLHDLASGRSFTCGTFDALVDSTCGYLASLGLHAGDLVSLVLDNTVEFCLLYLAALRSRVVVNPHPYMFIAGEILADLDATAPAAVFVQAERASEFAGRGGHTVVPIDTSGAGGFTDTVRRHAAPAARVEPAATDVACLYPSAGEPDAPRVIRYTQKNLAALVPSICRGFRFSSADVHLIVLPLAHTAALNYSLLPALACGGSVVLARSYWAIRDDFWTLVERHRVSYVQVVPTVLVMLLHMPSHRVPPVSLPYVACGSATLPPALQASFEAACGLRVANLYGLSETGPTHVDDPRIPGWTPGSIGVPLDVNDVAILDEEGRPLPDGQQGEIAIRGDNVFAGYAINADRTAASFARGFFRTGDAGLRNPSDGRFYFCGRRKRLIIKGGINIHPSEIDRVLLAHPEVAAVTTESAPDEYLGEIITSTIELRAGSRASEDDLRAHCRERLSMLKVPDVLRVRR